MDRRFVKWIPVALSFLMVVFFIDCGSPFRSREPLLISSPFVLFEGIESHASRLQTFQGRGRLSVNSAQGAFQGSIKISVKMPDSLWMKVEGPLGVDIATGRFAADHVVLYSPWENTVYEGTFQSMRDHALLPVDMGFSNMALSILGLLIPDYWTVDDSSLSVSSDSRKYIVDLGYGEYIWVEPRGPVISRWEKKDNGGETLWVWEAKEFRKRKGIRLPQIIRMTTYQPRQRVTLVYESIKTNRPMRDGWCRMKIPEGVETIEL